MPPFLFRLPARPRAIAAALSALALPACVPYPRMQRVVPPIEGVVTDAGLPVPQAAVLLSGAGEPSAATTDGAGRFRFKGIRQFEFGFILTSEPMTFWSVGIQHGERRRMGWSTASRGYPSGETVRLRCDLAATGEPVAGPFGEPMACKVER
jgi:hypothetical protein